MSTKTADVSAPHFTKNQHRWPAGLTLAALAGVLAVVFVVSFTLGQFRLPVSDILSVFGDKLGLTHTGVSRIIQTVVWQVRMPRILSAAIIGASLAAAGAAYQGLFRNPMVSPDLLGASTGAGFGAAVALMLSFNLLGISLLAFVVGIAAVALSYAVASSISRGSNAVLTLVLTGMVVSSLFSAFTSIIKYTADPDNKLPAITFWLMGGLSSITLSNIAMLLPPVLVGVVPMLLLRWKLNVLAFGDEEARTLGVNAGRMRLVFIVCSTLLTASAVSVSGMIGWVGLVIPHVARLFVGPNYKHLLPASMLTGAIFLIIADDVARVAFSAEVPLGILTSIIGAPFFIFLLFHGRSREA